MSEIRTERLVLRHFLPEDAVPLHAVMRDEETMRYWSTPPHKTLGYTAHWLAKGIETNASGEGDDFAVLLDGAVIGKAGIWRNCEVGFVFARPHWGKGFAREALSAVIAHARELGLSHLTADVDPRNMRSLAVLKHLGFVVTGEAKNSWLVGDVWVDSVYLERRLTPSLVIRA
jgi:[ribosomal protein S5]-alanine N-acetyltransferase